MNNKASITALMSSFGRAFHAENEDHPVFADHLAKELMTTEEYAAVQGYVLGGAQFFEPEIAPAKQESKELLRRLVNVHIAPSPLCRAAYTEQVLKAAVLTGTKQYVILGAGMDTFAFRETEFLSKHRVFEVDHSLTQADKLERITRAGWTIPGNLTFVPVDFTKDSLMECLVAAGFDLSVKTFFSWLGVTYYLSAEAIDTMLAALSGLCADTSVQGVSSEEYIQLLFCFHDGVSRNWRANDMRCDRFAFHGRKSWYRCLVSSVWLACF